MLFVNRKAATHTNMHISVLTGRQSIALTEKPAPKIGPNDVLVKIRSVGICGTDLHLYRKGVTKNARTIGHEFSGEVAETGNNVTALHVGDRVVAEHVITCHACYYCRHGK